MLEIDHVFFNIGSKQILNDVSLSFPAGLFHVILGPNGSGKSTLLRVFSGELKPLQGTVLYDQQDIFGMSKIELARRRSVMSQQAELQFPLQVAEIVMMGRYPHFNYKPSSRDHEVCNEVVSKMNLSGFLQRDYLTLSGGEKQRVQFARTLAQIWENPSSGSRYFFLDEPINNLDIYYQHQFLQAVKAFTSNNTITIAVLHDINLAIQYADHLSFMKNGKLVYHGKPEEIITSELIRDVFEIPVEVMWHPSSRRPYLYYGV